MNFSILHHREFTTGSDIGYGFRLGGERDSDERRDTQRLRVVSGLLLDDYRVVGTVEADDLDDAYQKTQNGMPFTDPQWRSRSTSVGDLLYAGDGEPQAWLVLSVGFLQVEVPWQVVRLLDRQSATHDARQAARS